MAARQQARRQAIDARRQAIDAAHCAQAAWAEAGHKDAAAGMSSGQRASYLIIVQSGTPGPLPATR